MKTIDLLDTQVIISKSRLVELLNQENQLQGLLDAGATKWVLFSNAKYSDNFNVEDFDGVELFEG